MWHGIGHTQRLQFHSSWQLSNVMVQMIRNKIQIDCSENGLFGNKHRSQGSSWECFLKLNITTTGQCMTCCTGVATCRIEDGIRKYGHRRVGKWITFLLTCQLSLYGPLSSHEVPVPRVEIFGDDAWWTGAHEWEVSLIVSFSSVSWAAYFERTPLGHVLSFKLHAMQRSAVLGADFHLSRGRGTIHFLFIW